MRRPPFALLSIVALLAAGTAVARQSDPDHGKPAAAVTREVRPVDGALAVCPELLKEGTGVVTRLTAGVATEGKVTVRATTLTRDRDLGAVVLTEGKTVGQLSLKSNTAVAAVVTATGPQSGGLEVEQVSRGDDGVNRGWAGLRCEPPVADSWFVGGSTSTGNTTQLVLVNPYDDAALARVEVYGKKGFIDIPELDGVVVSPRTRLTKELAQVAPDETPLVIHVLATEGRVAPFVRVHRTVGITPYGVDWLPRLREPAFQVDIPAAPAGNANRLLWVMVPGEDSATIRVQVTLPDEQIVPVGLEELEVPAGQPISIDMAKRVTVVDQRTGEVSRLPFAVRIYAEGAPVLATMFVESKARFTQIREMSYVGPAAPLTGPTLVTEARNVGEMDCLLLFHAPDGPARVEILTVRSRREKTAPIRRFVDVPQGHVVIFKYRSLPKDELASLVITPDPGLSPVYATRQIFEYGGRGPLFTTQALVTQPTAGLDIPFVVSDPTAALPRLPERT